MSRWSRLGGIIALLLTACSDGVHPNGDVSLAGRVVFVADTGRFRLHHMRPDGSDLRAIPIELPGSVGSIDIAPNGRQLAMAMVAPYQGDIFLLNADGSGLRNITETPSGDLQPRWSPDGSRIVFASQRRTNGLFDILVMEADGGGPQYLASTDADELGPAFSPDGRAVLFDADTAQDPEFEADIWVLSLDGGPPTRLTDAPGGDSNGDWSPDGSTIAFRTLREPFGTPNLWLMNADGSNQRPLISVDSGYGGGFPRWSPDGTRIAFAEFSDHFRIVSIAGRTVAGPFAGYAPAWGPAR